MYVGVCVWEGVGVGGGGCVGAHTYVRVSVLRRGLCVLK